MAEIQQFNLGQLLGQAEAIKGARRQNQLADLMAPIQQQSAQLGLDQARLAQTQQLARTALGILGDTPEQNWTQAVEFAKQRGADLTGLEQYSPQAYAAVQQLASGAGQATPSQFGGQQTFKDSKGNLFFGTTRRNPATGEVQSVLAPIGGGPSQPIGSVELVGQYGLTAGEQVSQKGAEAAATAGAQADVRLKTEPQIQAAITAAEAAATQAADIAAEDRSNSRAFSTYETGMKNLASALGSTTTGPVAGWLPAITSNAQVAEGAAAVMAPILKSLFREAGEGTFTEGDQKLLMDMLPSRTDHPEAAKAKMKFIDDLVRQKLNAGQAQTTNPQAGVAGDQSGGAISAPATAPAAPASGNIDSILNRYR